MTVSSSNRCSTLRRSIAAAAWMLMVEVWRVALLLILVVGPSMSPDLALRDIFVDLEILLSQVVLMRS